VTQARAIAHFRRPVAYSVATAILLSRLLLW
jgi:hypothetical protein